MPRLTTAPELRTERLTLRAHRLDDFDACSAVWSDPEVVRWIGGDPPTGEDNWSRLARIVGHWALLGFGYWAVIEKDGGGYLGDVGVFERRAVIDPRFDPAIEAGWALTPTAQGKGYANEAMSAILAWADANLDGRPIVCMIDAANAPSIRLAERLGFRRYGEGLHKDKTLQLFARESPPSTGNAKARP